MEANPLKSVLSELSQTLAEGSGLVPLGEERYQPTEDDRPCNNGSKSLSLGQVNQQLELQTKLTGTLRKMFREKLATDAATLPSSTEKQVAQAMAPTIDWAVREAMKGRDPRVIERYLQVMQDEELVEVGNHIQNILMEKVPTFFETELLRIRADIKTNNYDL